MTDKNTALSPDDLRRRCDPDSLGFTTTAELEPLERLIGQDRAIEAIGLAAGIRSSRFNLFVHGPEGTGRHTAVLSILHAEAATRPAPPDWVYVHNFDMPAKPRALSLPRGMGPVRSSMRKCPWKASSRPTAPTFTIPGRVCSALRRSTSLSSPPRYGTTWRGRTGSRSMPHLP